MPLPAMMCEYRFGIYPREKRLKAMAMSPWRLRASTENGHFLFFFREQ